MTWTRRPEACCAGRIKNPCGSGRALLPSASWLLVCHPTCARCRKGRQRLGVEPLAVAAQRVVSGWWLELSSQLLLETICRQRTQASGIPSRCIGWWQASGRRTRGRLCWTGRTGRRAASGLGGVAWTPEYLQAESNRVCVFSPIQFVAPKNVMQTAPAATP